MKIYRLQEKEVKLPAIGDKIRVELEDENQWATCMGYDYIGNPVFLFDNILTELPHDEAVKYCEEHGWFLPNKKDLDKWSLMQECRYRATGIKGDKYTTWWWLTNKGDNGCFDYISLAGGEYHEDMSSFIGVRPAFIKEIIK